MSASTGTTSSASVSTTPAFWERLWRAAGIQSVLCFIVVYIVYDHQPQVGASADARADFYDGDRMRSWRGAATASRAALGALFLLLIAVVAALAYSITGSGNHMLTSGPNDFVGRLRVDFVPARDAYHRRGV